MSKLQRANLLELGHQLDARVWLGQQRFELLLDAVKVCHCQAVLLRNVGKAERAPIQVCVLDDAPLLRNACGCACMSIRGFLGGGRG